MDSTAISHLKDSITTPVLLLGCGVLLKAGYEWIEVLRANRARAKRAQTQVSKANWIVIGVIVATAAVQLVWHAVQSLPKELNLEDTEDILPPGWDRELLEARLGSATGRRLAGVYGPAALASCAWCNVADPATFFLYAMPELALAHALNVLPVLIVTQGRGATPQANQWAAYTVWASVIALLTDLLGIWTATALTNPVHVVTALERGLVLATLDLILAALVYVSASGWAFDAGEAAHVRTKRTAAYLDAATSRVRVAVLLQSNVVPRTPALRELYCRWGAQRKQAHDKVRATPEVRQARDQALGKAAAAVPDLQHQAAEFVDCILP